MWKMSGMFGLTNTLGASISVTVYILRIINISLSCKYRIIYRYFAEKKG
jgi:hypothetical protein